MPVTLEDAAARFFPGGKVSGETLRGYVRKGDLRAYRVGRQYWTTGADVKEMLNACRVKPESNKPPSQSRLFPNQLGLTESDLSRMNFEKTMADLQSITDRERAERKRLKLEEAERTAPARLVAAKARRSANSKKRYQRQKRERLAKQSPT